jgi:hypothetical protein
MPGRRRRAAGGPAFHRIVWSACPFWSISQNVQPFLDALTPGLTALITSAVAGLGLRPTHPEPGPETMSMHLVLRR